MNDLRKLTLESFANSPQRKRTSFNSWQRPILGQIEGGTPQEQSAHRTH